MTSGKSKSQLSGCKPGKAEKSQINCIIVPSHALPFPLEQVQSKHEQFKIHVEGKIKFSIY